MQVKAASLKKHWYKNASMAMLAVYVFLLNIFVKYFVPGIVTKILPILAVGILILLNKRKALKIKKNMAGYFLFGFLYLAGSIYSDSPQKGLLYALSYMLAILFATYCSGFYIDWKRIIIFITIVCSVMTAGTLLQSTEPGMLKTITALFPYSTNERYLVEAWARNRWFCGLFPDRAPAAFFSCMQCGAGIFFLLGNQRKESKFVRLFGLAVYLFGVWGIFLTAKRGPLFGMILATLVCYLVNRRASGKSILFFVAAAVAILSFSYAIVQNLTVAEVMLARIFESNDFFTNRLDIYSRIFEIVQSHFIIGTGTASAYARLGVGGHNIYLTVLMENGIFGVIVFVFVWFWEIIRTAHMIILASKRRCNEYTGILTFSLFIQSFFVVYGMSGNPLYDNYILNFYFLGVLMNENAKTVIEKAENSNHYISCSV